MAVVDRWLVVQRFLYDTQIQNGTSKWWPLLAGGHVEVELG